MDKNKLWEHALHGWYKDKQFGIQAAQLLLNIDPDNFGVLNNIEHYLTPLPYIEKKVINKSLSPDFHPMNTCLTRHKDKIFAFVRTVNYIVDKGNYHAGPPDQSYTSITELLIFDEKLNYKQLPIANQEEKWSRHGQIYGGGYEDIRILPKASIIGDGRVVWQAIGGRYLSEEIKLFRFTISYDEYTDQAWISPGKKIKYGGEVEKNWIPVEHNPSIDELTLIYQYSPLRVIILDNKAEIKEERYRYTKSLFKYDNYRGGSPVWYFKGRYLAIIHQTRCFGDRHYFNRFVELNQQYDIIGISDAFSCGSGQPIEYIMGIAQGYDTGYIYIAVGVNDKELHMFKLSMASVLEMIHEDKYYIDKYLEAASRYSS